MAEKRPRESTAITNWMRFW